MPGVERNELVRDARFEALRRITSPKTTPGDVVDPDGLEGCLNSLTQGNTMSKMK